MNRDDLRTTYRILDASANRASEGLRTLEEYTRFGLNDPSLTEAVKRLRHDLGAALSLIPREGLLQARDTPGDVGTQLQVESEYNRPGIASVIAAASARTQQSLRCLEEYGKLVSVELAQRVEAVRYRCYGVTASIERHTLSSSRRRELLSRSRLYVLCDAADDESAFIARLRCCIAGGVDVIQLRDRRCTDRVLFDRARIAVGLLRDADVLFIVNDRADLAVACDADGVHVGQDELPAVAVRGVVGPDRLVGISTHSLEQALEAEQAGADYIGCGPVFPSQTKAFDGFVGPELLQQVAREVAVPAFAIGGITLGNLSAVTSAGFGRIAVSAAVWSAPEIQTAARDLVERLAQ